MTKAAVKANVAARRERLLKLITEDGHKSASVRELAQLLTTAGYECSHPTVVSDLKAVRAQLAASIEAMGVDLVGEQIADLNALYDTLWPDRADPKVAAILIKISERKAKLLGLDAAQRVEVTGDKGGPVAVTVDTDPILRTLAARAAGEAL
jgi:hypothetical protein